MASIRKGQQGPLTSWEWEVFSAEFSWQTLFSIKTAAHSLGDPSLLSSPTGIRTFGYKLGWLLDGSHQLEGSSSRQNLDLDAWPTGSLVA